VRLEGLGQLKKSTSSGLEPSTFRLVAWCLNQLRKRVALVVTRQRPVNSNRGTVFTVRSVPRCYKQDKLGDELVGK
jgi:hypothetical protein